MTDAWFDELREFLRIPSISADPARAGDVRAAGEWVRDFVRDAGGDCQLIEQHGQPLVVGELRASTPRAAPTVLVYGHFDVQPPEPLELWESDPFEPVIREGYLYGRGTVDDKGQLYMLLAGARALARAGELPVNLRFCCDGEEEVGGSTIIDFIAADERRVDAAVIFDTAMADRGLPVFNIAARGLLYFHLVIRTGERDLHSGDFGGVALNAAHALMRVCSALVAHDGRLAEALRLGREPVTDQELEDWRRLPSGAERLEDQGAMAADAAAAGEFYLRTFAEPSFDVNGFESGSPQLQKTVLPVEARANVSIRLAPGQDVETIRQAAEQLMRDAVPAGAQLDITLKTTTPPALIPPASRAIALGCDAFERALGARPALVRFGGTIPLIPALVGQGIPTILTGFGLPDSRVHSPNERLLADHMPLGIRSARELFLALGGL